MMRFILFILDSFLLFGYLRTVSFLFKHLVKVKSLDEE
ncbi:hypothetical protein SAMN04488156_102161 [Bacillus sp. 166amftsu]|nr:hypothetical protein SAMN04488156_102161 [Bacillus sp. 166amftsu]